MPKSNSHSVNPDCESRISRLEYTTLDKRTGLVKNVEEHSLRLGKIEKAQFSQSIIVRTVILGLTAIVIIIQLYQSYLMYLATVSKS